MKFPLRAAVVSALLSASSLAAQARGAAANPISFNIAAGATIPTGDLGDFTDVGYNLTVGLGGRQAGSPLGFRAEGMYNEWGISNTSLKTHTGAVTANATYDFGTPSTTGNFYGIGGLGYYFSGNSANDFGWNIGGGFKFPLSGFSAYVEARYHAVSNQNRSFVPIVFGLKF